MLVLGNRRHNNRIVTRPQIHVQNTPPIHENEQNIQTIKQEHNTTKPKKRVKPSSDFSGYESDSSYNSEYSDKKKDKKHSERPDRMYDPLNPHGHEDHERHDQHHDRHGNRYKHEKDKSKSRHNKDKDNSHKDRQSFSMPRRMNRHDDSSGPSSSTSSSDTESDRRIPRTNKDNRHRETSQDNNLLGNMFSQSQIHILQTLLQQNATATDLNIAKILKLIPNNLIWGSCQHDRIFKQIKVLGKIPNSYGESTNPYTFFSTFKYLEEYEDPFTHSSYNNILIHYFNTESRNKLDMLEIDPNALSAQDFVKSILTTIGAELLNPQDYERKFHTYRITPEDEDRPNRTVINLAAMLQKTGNSQENQMAKLREKICTYLVPPLLQSAFLSSTNVPNCSKETILSWFSNNRSFYTSAIERKRKMDRQRNANVNQVGKEDKPKNDKPKSEQSKANNNNNKGGNSKKDQNPTQEISTKPKPTCEHCKKPHWSKHCLRHPDPAIRKANAEWWDKKTKEKALNNRIVCLLCNSDTHGSADCPTYPNTTPAQEQCPRCMHYGITRRHHPLSSCKLPAPAEKNG